MGGETRKMFSSINGIKFHKVSYKIEFPSLGIMSAGSTESADEDEFFDF